VSHTTFEKLTALPVLLIFFACNNLNFPSMSSLIITDTLFDIDEIIIILLLTMSHATQIVTYVKM